MSLPVLIGVALLGGLGAVLRRLVDGAVGDRTETRLPAGILLVNLTGALALGILDGAGASAEVMRLLGIGLLGGYTTFSAWMLGSDRLIRHRRRAHAVGYLAGSAVLGVALVWAGHHLGADLRG